MPLPESELVQLLHTMRQEMADMRLKMSELESRLSRGVQPEMPGKFPLNLLTDRNQFNRECARMLSLDNRLGGSSSIAYFELSHISAAASLAASEADGPPAQRQELIQELAGVLCRHVRSCDVAGYLGPNEFAVLLTRCNEESAWKKADELAALLQQKTNQILSKPHAITVLHGVFAFHLGGDIHAGLKAAAGAILQKQG